MAEFTQTGGSNGGSYAKYFTGRLTVWENSYDISTNSSNVGYKLELVSGSSGRFSTYSASYSVTLDGTVVNSGSGTYSSQSYNTAQTICEGTTTIYHNSDGTKSIACSAVLDFASGTYSPGDFYPSGTLALTTIPRASILYVSNGTINDSSNKPTFTIDRKSSGFTDSIYYINPANNQEVLIVNKTSSTSYSSWTPPTSLYSSLASNSNNIYMTFKSYTYNGSTLVGTDTAHAYIYAKEADVRPTLSVTLTPTNYSSLTGSATTIIKGVSNVAISATATPKYNATITSIKTNNQTVATGASGSKTLSKVETGTFNTIATDSRGFSSATSTTTYTMVNYIPLTISATANRANQTSSTIKAVVTGDYFDGSFGSQSNTLTLTWQCKNSESGNYVTGGTLTATKSNGKFTTGEITLSAPSGIDFSYESDIYFLFKAVDKIETTGKTSTPVVRKGTPIFDYGVDANGNNYVNFNATIYKNNVDFFKLIYPVGSIYMSVNSTNPGTLFGGTWTAWGAGRVPVGINTSDTDFNTVEKTGGSKLLQKHTHSGTTGGAGGHSHYMTGRAGNGSGGTQVETYSSGDNARTVYTNTVNDHTHSFTTGEAGTGTSGNLQPYITCYMWKRTA